MKYITGFIGTIHRFLQRLPMIAPKIMGFSLLISVALLWYGGIIWETIVGVWILLVAYMLIVRNAIPQVILDKAQKLSNRS